MSAEAPIPQQQSGESNRDRLALPVADIAKKLVYSHRGMLHFQKAVDIAGQTEGTHVGNVFLGVAREMVEAGITPTKVVEGLTTRRGSFRENHYNDFLDECIVNAHAMMGNLSRLGELMPDLGKYKDPNYPEMISGSIRPDLYASEAAARNGENPTPILEDVINRIANSPNPQWGEDHLGRVMSYMRVAETIHKVGLDPNMAFSKAEAEISNAKSAQRDVDPRACEGLAAGYAAVGNYAGALRMIEYLSVEEGSTQKSDENHVRNILGSVTIRQNEGDFDKALEIAQRFGWPVETAKILARKAVSEARNGIQPHETISQLDGIVTKKEIASFENVYPKVYLALALSGDAEAAKSVFNEIVSAIDEEEEFYAKAEMQFALAEAVDEAGEDAAASYRQAFTLLDEFRGDDPQGLDQFFGVSFDIHQAGVDTLIDHDHLDLAKEYAEKYPEDPGTKAPLMSKLASAEISRGFKPEEIKRLSPTDTQAILVGNNEEAKQALGYFGLAA